MKAKVYKTNEKGKQQLLHSGEVVEETATMVRVLQPNCLTDHRNYCEWFALNSKIINTILE